MATSTNAGRNSKRASVILKQRQAEWQRTFKSCHGDPKKVRAAAKEYHKKYGATAKARWHKAQRDAKGFNKDTQIKLRMR